MVPVPVTEFQENLSVVAAMHNASRCLAHPIKLTNSQHLFIERVTESSTIATGHNKTLGSARVPSLECLVLPETLCAHMFAVYHEGARTDTARHFVPTGSFSTVPTTWARWWVVS